MAELSDLDVRTLLQINTLLQTVVAKLPAAQAPAAPPAPPPPAPPAPPAAAAQSTAPAAAPDPKVLAPDDSIVVTSAPAAADDPNKVTRPVAWGARVSKTFVARAWWTAVTLGFDPDWLMSYMAWESGRTFKPDVKNMAGSGATGLIQFMPKTAIGLGTTVDALAKMTAEDQLSFVYKYFRPYAGKIHTVADGYMTILLPSAVGQPDDDKLFTGGTAYRENSGLDADKDGVVTKLEASAKVLATLAAGRMAANMGMGA